jgi:hypothetical protein
VADGDLDGDPNTGAWGDAASYTVPLENGEDPPYGTATLYVKHDATYVYYRIDGYIDVPWISTTAEHFWLGIVISETGTSHHSGATWDGIFFGESNYLPEPTYPPAPVDTYGFGKPPAKDASQDALGAMRYYGSAAPFSFTAEWKKALNTGDADDIALVADGATTYNFFITTDSDGKGSSGGAISHKAVTNLNTMKFEAPAPPTVVHDVAVTEVTASPSTVVVGETVTVSVTVENQGTVSENFDVTAYYDSTPIGTQTVTLASGGSTTLTFSWDTTDVSPGTYTISAEAPLAEDTDPGDNSYIDGTVTVESAPAVVSCELAGLGRKPGSILPGGTMTFKARVKNTGTVDVEFFVDFTIRDPWGNVVGSVPTVISVEPVGDGPTSVSVTWVVPLDAVSGEYSVEGTLYYREAGSDGAWIQGETLLTWFKVRG